MFGTGQPGYKGRFGAGCREFLPLSEAVRDYDSRMFRKLFAGLARESVWRDVGVAGALAMVAGWVAANLEIQERLFALSRRWEHLQIDEAFSVALVFSVCMVMMYARRLRQLRRALEDNRLLARRNLEMQEQERRRLAQELHDELGQYLNAIKVDARGMGATMSSVELQTCAERIAASADHAYAAAGAIVRRLRPPALDDLGLEAALEACVARWRQSHPQLNTRLTVHGDIDALPESLGLVVYRLVQEGLTNCVRHANASQLDIEVRHVAGEDGELRVSLRDDGRGQSAGDSPAGHGIAGMRERVELLGGRFLWLSTPGRGVTIEACFPRQAGDPGC